jgi:hypothetical protein
VANKLIRQNPDFVEADVTEYLAREFGGDPKYFTMDPTQKKTSFSSRVRNQSARLVAKGRQIVDGAAIIIDWLGDGLKPVEQAEAQARAAVCLGRNGGVPCPHNNPGFKPVETIAEIIRAWSEKKNELNLSVIGEEKLHTCDVCFCHIPTKAWCPMDTISGQTPKAMFNKFASEAPKNCWMRIENHKTPAKL